MLNVCASFFQLAIGSWNMYVEQAWQHVCCFSLEIPDKFFLFLFLKKKQEVLIVAYDDDSHADSACVAIPRRALGHILGCLICFSSCTPAHMLVVIALSVRSTSQ